jgi:tetratricopeptide (TPR) repeat protein
MKKLFAIIVFLTGSIILYSQGIDVVKVNHRCSEHSTGPRCPHGYMKDANKAISLLQIRDYQSASKYINKAISKAGKANLDMDNLYYIKAQISAKQGQYDNAVTSMSFKGSVVGELDNYNMAVYSLKKGDYQSSILYFNEHLGSSDKFNHECHWGIGYAYLHLANYDKAIGEFTNALEFRDNPEVRIGMAEAYFAMNQRDSAIAELTAALKLFPSNNRVKSNLYNYQANNDDLNIKAKTKAVINGIPEEVKFINLGNKHFKNGNYKLAQEFYDKLNGVNIAALVGKGNVYLAKNNFKLAKTKFQEVIKLDPQNPCANEALGIISFSDINYYDAMMYFVMVESGNPNYKLSYDALICKATISLNQNNLMEAAKLFKMAIERSNSNSWAHAGLGVTLSKMPNFNHNTSLINEASKHFKAALKSDPNNPQFLMHEGLSQYHLEKYHLAITNLEASIKNGLKSADVHNTLAMSYAKINDFVRSRKSMENARKLAPESPFYLINSGLIETEYANYLLKTKKSDNIDSILIKMNAYYDAAIQMGIDSSVIHINRGYGYVMVKEYDTAHVIYNRVINADSIVIAAKYNNIGVTHGLEFNVEQAEDNFYLAEISNPSGYLDMISKNQNRIPSYDGIKTPPKRDELISVVFYYLPVSIFTPHIGDQANVPEIYVSMNPPNEILELEAYQFQCDQYYSFKLELRKGFRPKQINVRKSTSACPTF